MLISDISAVENKSIKNVHSVDSSLGFSLQAQIKRLLQNKTSYKYAFHYFTEITRALSPYSIYVKLSFNTVLTSLNSLSTLILSVHLSLQLLDDLYAQ